MPDTSHADSVSWELFNRKNENLNTWALQSRAGVLISSRIRGDPACLMEVEIGGKQSAFSLVLFLFSGFLIYVLRLRFQGRNVIFVDFPHDYVLQYNHSFH